jgi:hypothetical protein
MLSDCLAAVVEVPGGPANEGEQPLIDPKLDGNKLSWKSAITRPIKVTATMQLTFDGDTVTGTARAGMFPRRQDRRSTRILNEPP